jgi:hypothetical protein
MHITTVKAAALAVAIAAAVPSITFAFGAEDMSALRQAIGEAQAAMRATTADHQAAETGYRSAIASVQQCRSAVWARSYAPVLDQLESHRRAAEAARRGFGQKNAPTSKAPARRSRSRSGRRAASARSSAPATGPPSKRWRCASAPNTCSR